MRQSHAQRLKAQAKKTFNDIPCVPIAAFQEARAFIEKICTGHVAPETVQRLHRKAVDYANRHNQRPIKKIKLQTDDSKITVIRRKSGLLVPEKYGDDATRPC